MKTRNIYLMAFIFVFSNLSFAQLCSCGNKDEDCVCKSFYTLRNNAIQAKNTICSKIGNELYTMQKQNDSTIKKGKLITDYTFRRTFINDFAKVVLQENSFASQVRHADLTIDEDKSKFSFSPFVFHNPNLIYKPLTYFGSLQFTGTIDDNAIFKAFDKSGLNRSFDVKLNFNIVPNFWNGTNFKTRGKENCLRKFNALRECAYYEICKDNYNEYDILLDSCRKINELTDKLDVLCDTSQLKENILNRFADTEQKLSSPFWTRSSKTWFTISASPYGYQEYAALDIYKKTLVNKDHYSPSGSVAFNRLVNWLGSGNSFYFNLLAEVAWKNSFADKTTSTWNSYNKLSDSTFNTIETKDVYAYDSLNYSEKFLPNFSGQLIYICKDLIFGMPMGIDITGKIQVLPALTKGSSDYQKNVLTIGLIFPFDDKDGNRIINLEAFYSLSSYSTKKLKKEEFFGLKFSLPIFSKS